MKHFNRVLFLTLAFLMVLCQLSLQAGQKGKDKEKWLTLQKKDLSMGTYHTSHYKIFKKYTSGYNLEVLKGIDKVQAHAMDGGGYFIGVKATPAESPVYYELKLFNKSLITPPRQSSYCSGSSYSAFVEALNLILSKKAKRLSAERLEALRMQEPDGKRREDWVKFWGIWNADGFGSEFALEQYSSMGVAVKPEDARPGDFVNISWKSGVGHSVVFLGWYIDENNNKNMVYWSSQKSSNGYGDQVVSLSKIKEVKFVRLTKPENLFNFDINAKINKDVPGDVISW
ncbi:MAG: hypothetical protein HF314_13165 [Ignavibacteria bacterium]|nr:hypothetical protein [Ignavibacteria bacterium]MCU7504026.1 hypothetical protein [Ignavibacteria bacterium]MCU7515398.1 hypothetical protein [Ignavibacteria bacterium]